MCVGEVVTARVDPYASEPPTALRRGADHSRTLEAIAWKYRTSSPWRDLADESGSFQTAHK
ncbi:IS5/IS1182 family transposase, partial [Streptomyces olivaceoviridis]